MLFPTEYPFDSQNSTFMKIYMKYYQTQYLYFALYENYQYANFEVMVNAFKTNTIDFSEAKIYQYPSTKMSIWENM